jgi:hypothetical protein
MSDAPAPPDPPAALADVVDDLTPREDALEWAVAQLAAGREFDDVAAELVAAGWPGPDAAEIVERARRATRARRGVVTRDDVVTDVNRRYRRAMTPGWFLGMPTVAAAMRLLHSLATLTALRPRDKPSGPKSEDESH